MHEPDMKLNLKRRWLYFLRCTRWYSLNDTKPENHRYQRKHGPLLTNISVTMFDRRNLLSKIDLKDSGVKPRYEVVIT